MSSSISFKWLNLSSIPAHDDVVSINASEFLIIRQDSGLSTYNANTDDVSELQAAHNNYEHSRFRMNSKTKFAFNRDKSELYAYKGSARSRYFNMHNDSNTIEITNIQTKQRVIIKGVPFAEIFLCVNIRSHVGSILSHVYFLTVNKSKPIWQSVFTDLPFLLLVAFDTARSAL